MQETISSRRIEKNRYFMSTPQIDKMTIEDWLIRRIATETSLDPGDIEKNVPFSNYNLDSIGAVTVAADLETWLKKQIDPTIFWEFDTIEDLAEWLQNHDLGKNS